MKQKIITLISLLTILLSSCNNIVERADNLRLDNKFEEAAELYKQAAAEGNSYAKWRLANAYNNGDGVEFNEKKAWTFLNEAAEGGCPQAICDIALTYIYGWFGIDKDIEKGKQMLENLCDNTQDSYSLTYYAVELLDGSNFDKNEEKAMSILNNINNKQEPYYLRVMAWIYFEGVNNTEVDKNKAMDFFKQSYNKGNGYSAKILGDCYLYNNPPFKKDPTKAVEWYEKGIQKNNTESMIAMANICLENDTLFANWHDVRRGISLLEKAGIHGNGDAYTQLGYMYESGTNVYIDEKKSFEYYTKAYKLRSGWGTNNLGVFYSNGTGCEKNIDKALELYTEASDWGNGKASHNLYRYYYESDNMRPHDVDLALAKQYLLKSVEQGEVNGNVSLGYHYYYGSNLFEKDLYKSFNYYKQAADMGDVSSCQAVAYRYDKGIGIERDPNKSKEYADKTKPKDNDKKEESEDK